MDKLSNNIRGRYIDSTDSGVYGTVIKLLVAREKNSVLVQRDVQQVIIIYGHIRCAKGIIAHNSQPTGKFAKHCVRDEPHKLHAPLPFKVFMESDAYKCIMIKRVRLKNWRSHYDTNLRFDKGTNVIIGINGAGKSSVLEAIFFALFGPPEKGYYERVLREGSTEGTVELVFEINGKEYSVKRVFSAKGQKLAELRGAKTVITGRPKDVDAEIVKIIGMNQKIFKEAVYARQNEMAYILRDATPQERKRLFDDLIELGEFSTAKQIVTKVRNRIKRELDIFRSQNWEDARKKAEETIDELEKRRSTTLAQIRELEEKLAKAKELLSELSRRSEEIKNKVQALADIKDKAARIQGAIKEKEATLKEIEAKWGKIEEASEEEIRKIESEIQRIEDMQRELAALRKEEQILQERINELRKHITSAPTEAPNVKELEQKLAKLNEETMAMQEALRRVEITLASLQERKNKVRERIKELKSELEHAESVEKQIKEISERYGNIEERLSKFREEIQEITAEIAKNNTKIEQEKTFIESLHGANRCPVCGSELNENKVQSLIIEHRKALTSAQEAVTRLKQRLKELQELISELEEANKKMQALKQSIRSTEDVRKDLSTAEEELKKLEEEEERLVREKKEYEEKIVELVKRTEEAKRTYDEALRVEAMVREVERAKTELTQMELKIKQVRADIESKEKSLASKDIDALKKERERLADMIRAAEIQAKLLVERGELQSLEEKLKELEPSEAEFRETLIEQKKTEEKIASITRLLTEYKNQLEYVEKDLQRQREELKRIKEQMATARKKEEIKNALEKMESALAGTQEIVRNARILAVNKVLNIVWREIYVGGDIPEIRMRPTQSDYILEVKRKSGHWIPVTNLSGGEFYDAAIALRIAISAIKNRKLGWLLLDEPTHNLDSDSAQALALFLNKLPETGLFKQIIVITHDETFRAAATGTTYIFTRDKAKGSPTKWEVVGE